MLGVARCHNLFTITTHSHTSTFVMPVNRASTCSHSEWSQSVVTVKGTMRPLYSQGGKKAPILSGGQGGPRHLVSVGTGRLQGQGNAARVHQILPNRVRGDIMCMALAPCKFPTCLSCRALQVLHHAGIGYTRRGLCRVEHCLVGFVHRSGREIQSDARIWCPTSSNEGGW